MVSTINAYIFIIPIIMATKYPPQKLILSRSPWTVTISCSRIQTHPNQTRWISNKPQLTQTTKSWLLTKTNLIQTKQGILLFRPKHLGSMVSWSRLKSKPVSMLSKTRQCQWRRKSPPNYFDLTSILRGVFLLFKVHLLNGDGEVKFTSRHKEDVLRSNLLCTISNLFFYRSEDEHPDFIHAFNAYSPPGNVTGDLVFVPSWLKIMTEH